MTESDEKTLLIAGCGYLGQEIARRWRLRGGRVVGLTRSQESARELSKVLGIPVIGADLGDKESMMLAKAAMPAVSHVVHAASSSRGGPEAYRHVFVQGIQNLSEVFAPERMVFTSSTSVYAQTDGAEVDEQSPAHGGSETSKILREAEELALARGATVARLAGIYGPDRCVVLRKFFDKSNVLEEGGVRVINQIHRDDAAEAILHLLNLPEAVGQIYNVADDTPMAQLDVLTWLAKHFKQPLPPVGPKPEGRKRGWTSKAVSNKKMRSTGWRPEYGSFFDAVLRDGRLVGRC